MRGWRLWVVVMVALPAAVLTGRYYLIPNEQVAAGTPDASDKSVEKLENQLKHLQGWSRARISALERASQSGNGRARQRPDLPETEPAEPASPEELAEASRLKFEEALASHFPEPAEEERQVREMKAFLEENMAATPPDAAWTEAVQQNAAAAIKKAELAGASVSDVTCSSTICRMEVGTGDAPVGLTGMHLKLLMTDVAGHGRAFLKEDESSITYYFARPGERLPESPSVDGQDRQ